MRVQGIGLLATAALLTLAASASAQVVGNVYLRTVRVSAVPKPPASDFWDYDAGAWGRFVGSLIRSESASFYPDIEVCIGSRAACKLVCVNAQLNADDPKLRPLCGLQLEAGVRLGQLVDANGQRQWQLRDLEFEVNDIAEDGSTANRRTMGRLAFYAGADPPILQPDRCTESEPCMRTIEMEGGPLSMSFTTIFIETATQPPPRLPGAPPGDSSKTAPEPEGRLARVWNATSDWLGSWFESPSVPWKPFVQGRPNECCVHPGDVIQGWYDDCFVLSALAAVATASPGSIKGAIRDNGNGTFTVSLPGTRAVVVNSTPYEPSDITKMGASIFSGNWGRDTLPFPHSQPADGGLEVWPMLFERAYARAIVAPTKGLRPEELDDRYLQNLFTGGGDSSGALSAITGQRSKSLLLAPMPPSGLGGITKAARDNFHSVYAATVSTEAQLRSELERLRDLTKTPGARVAMTAGTIGPCPAAYKWWDVFSWFPEPPPPQMDGGFPTNEFRCYAEGQPPRRFADGTLKTNHAYYIKGFDGKHLRLGNPFGGVDVPPLPLADVLDSFRAIYYVVFQRPQGASDCDCTLTP